MRTALFIALALLAAPAAAMAQSYSCSGDAAAMAGKRLTESESPQQAAVDKAAGQAFLAQIDALRRDLNEGKALAEPYDSAGRFATLAHDAKDPMLAELFRRTAMDQFARLHAVAYASHTGWAAGLTPGAAGYVFSVAATRDWCGLDEANTAWLEKQIDAHGWFKRSAGEGPANAAFLLVQHADANKPFQKKVLAMMEPLLAAGEVRPQNYALLFDRVAVGEGRPQRYGSQGGCTGPGVWTEKPVEDAASLDQTRAKVGLEPMAAYRARFVASCGGPAPASHG